MNINGNSNGVKKKDEIESVKTNMISQLNLVY